MLVALKNYIGGSVAIQMWRVVWDCLWLWELNDPLGPIEKSRALCPSPGFLPGPDIAINACETAIKPDSISQFKELQGL